MLLITSKENTTLLNLLEIFSDLNLNVQRSNSFDISEIKITENNYKFIFINLDLNVEKGFEFLRFIKSKNNNSVVIMYTSNTSVEMAVNAMKKGADEYFTIPLDFNFLKKTLIQYISYDKNNSIINREKNELNYNGNNKNIISLNNMIRKITNIPSSILITGESGTGKGFYAKKIHNTSKNKHKPFIHVDCASIPANLLESELFGHKKGAFTGAIKDKKGKFEIAKDGTLFLDEIATLPLSLQVKLLNTLQEKTFYPVGSENYVELKARIITATNEDLKEKIEKKLFREDLYYRINVIQLDIPPLRNRKDDIANLVYEFINKYKMLFDIPKPKVTSNYMQALYKYNWPGNIRELENTIESSIALCDNNTLKYFDLPDRIKENISKKKQFDRLNKNSLNLPIDINTSLSEKRSIISALKINEGHRQNTADFLGISRRKLQYRLKKYNLLEIDYKNYNNN